MGRIAGKAALIAGAGGGAGAEATAARIREAGGQAAASSLDLRDRAAVYVAAIMPNLSGKVRPL